MSTADRIIIKTLDRKAMVWDWFFGNKEWLDKQEFHAPLESGIICFEEEGLDISFWNGYNGVVVLTIHPVDNGRPLPPIVQFKYNPVTQEESEHKYAPLTSMPEDRRAMLAMVIDVDHTTHKAAVIYHALMQFMTYYHEDIVVEESREQPLTANKSKKKQKRKIGKSTPIIKRRYILPDSSDVHIRRLDGEHRKYTKPDHEVNVRGYYRHYKSGKVIWIEPSVRYKDHGKKQRKEYLL